MAEDIQNKTDNSPAQTIVFYCKDCQKLVEKPIKVPGKYVYKCAECGTKNVAFGTVKSIQNFYHLNDNAARSVPVEN